MTEGLRDRIWIGLYARQFVDRSRGGRKARRRSAPTPRNFPNATACGDVILRPIRLPIGTFGGY